MARYLLAIDQGSSGSRAIIMDQEGEVCGYGYEPLRTIYPQPGWAEIEPYDLVHSVRVSITRAIDAAGCHPSEIKACTIACQRSTEFVWDAKTGEPLANGISWQDLRTNKLVQQIQDTDLYSRSAKTLGYLPGPWSSALHIWWRMQHEQATKQAANNNRLRIGLGAAWLITALGKQSGHHMDYSLVQALGAYDFRAEQYWDEWLAHLAIPRNALPEPVPTLHDFGSIQVSNSQGISADVPVVSVLGNEQASLFGHGCRTVPGSAECSQGTTTFIDVFMGNSVDEVEKLNAYFAWNLGDQHTYCLEADTTVSGAVVRWMRHQLRMIDVESEVGELAATVPDSGGVVFVPAFTGLNVPYRDIHARGSLLGMTLATSRAHVARSFLDAIGHQLRAILDTFSDETHLTVEQLYMGGGLTTNDTVCQIMADQIGIPVLRPKFSETAAHGAVLLAGMGIGVWSDIDELPPLPDGHTTFEPLSSDDQRNEGYARWNRAVDHIMKWE